jgi:hypothetical protein
MNSLFMYARGILDLALIIMGLLFIYDIAGGVFMSISLIVYGLVFWQSELVMVEEDNDDV